MDFASLIKILSLLLTVLTALCYSYQLVYLLLPLIRGKQPLSDAAPRHYAILIAARNEEAVLPHLLDSIAAQDYPAEYITTYVIADNCTDRTAQVSRDHGAIVFQRTDSHRVGKGYALNYLLEQIRCWEGLEQFDAFLIFDADNLLDSSYVSQINRLCAGGYPAFCGCRNTKNYGDNWLSAGYGLWYLHESVHLNHSRMALGTTCAVSGTGFGFTRELLEQMGGWHFFTLTEDIEFSTWCAARGIRIGYCPDAVVYDEQPVSLMVSVRQRTRWVQGGIQVALRYAKDLLHGILQGGRTGWSCFDFTTLTFWGYGLGTLGFLLTLASTFVETGWTGIARILATALVCGYLSMFAMGALTLATEWKHIHAGPIAKLLSLFTFPVYLYTYVPIAVTAVFRRHEWKPIAHTRAISCAQMQDCCKK